MPAFRENKTVTAKEPIRVVERLWFYALLYAIGVFLVTWALSAWQQAS